MKRWFVGFNIYLCAAATLVFSSGCETDQVHESDESDPSKQLTAMKLHIQALPDPTKITMEVPVFRARPMLLTIEKTPFLTEGSIVEAEVVDDPGGFSIQIEFDREGGWLLEKYTAGNVGRRIAVFSSFSKERWLAAPVIQNVISDRKLTFTPDASREEAIRIVRGLKNVAKKMDHDPRF